MISILMPIYNGIEYIDESVSSILRQTYTDWELIIGVNGHPKDSDTYLLAKNYEKKSNKIKVFDLYEIKGKSNTLNKMIQYCNYNYIALLDVDDIWFEDKLLLQSQVLDKFDVIGSKCIWIGERPGVIPNIPVGNISDFDFKLVNPIINSSCIIKKDLCYWDPLHDGIEDYDLWLRLKKSSKMFFNFKEILVKHRIHNTSAFNSKGNHLQVKDLIQKYECL